MSAEPVQSLEGSPSRSSASDAFACVRRDPADGVVRLSLSGELDIAYMGALDGVLRAAEPRATAIVLDLDRLGFVDCSGARVLRAAAARARSRGHALIAVNAAAHVETWLRLMAVDRCLKLVPAEATPAEAGRRP